MLTDQSHFVLPDLPLLPFLFNKQKIPHLLFWRVLHLELAHRAQFNDFHHQAQ
jgi:hypothetical protein